MDGSRKSKEKFGKERYHHVLKNGTETGIDWSHVLFVVTAIS
jgi:hypothetical protein